MSAINQYLDLYTQHKELVDSNSAHALNALRTEAFIALESMTLPKAGSDNYENCDLEALLAPDYGLNIANVPIDVNPSATLSCDVPTVSRSLSMLINDTYTASGFPGNVDGVEICSLREAAVNHPDLVKDYYGKLANLSNPIVALDTLLAQDGMFLYVKKGTKLEKPLQLINILENGAPLMAVRRILIVIEEDADAKLLVCDHTQNPETDFLSLETVEIFVGKNARFDYYSLEESSQKTKRLSSLYLKQEEGSNVTVDGLTLFNGYTRNEYNCSFEGENATLNLFGLAIEDDNRKISTYSNIAHKKPNCKSEELFKYTADDNATASFTGRIYVDYGATGTEAYQANRNLIGSDSATITSRPELEIYNDDVKCSHGCAIGRLDDMQLFYMRTRGLSEDTARLLLKQAFMADVIDKIEIPVLRDKLHLMVERRFAGEKSACQNCTLKS